MMRALRFLLGLAAAVMLFIAFHWISPDAARLFDPFLVLVLYHAIRTDPASSAAGGTVAGLAQDALTGGLFGLHGFANTLVAYLATSLRQRFVVQRPLQVGLLCLLGAAVQTVTLTLLQFVMVSGADLPAPDEAILRAGLTAILGTLTYMLSVRFFSWEKGWREQRQKRLRLDTQ